MNRCCGLLLLSVGLASGVAGCGSSDKVSYANVSGTVTFNGTPLPKGQVIFSAEGRPPTVMDVTNGKFNGQAIIGSNRIQVSARKKSAAQPKLNDSAKAQIKGYQEKMKGNADTDGDPSAVESLPKEWNSESKQMRVVEAGAPNDFKFEITGK